MARPIDMSGDEALILAKKYTKETVEGAGAIKGKSAYEIAVEEGYTGTESEWLASLEGEQGPQGEKGDKGDKGDQGEKGEKGDPGSGGVKATYDPETETATIQSFS